MKSMGKFSFSAILLTIVLGVALAQDKGKQTKSGAMPVLTLTSTAFADGGEIPAKFTQESSTPVSPQLEWKNTPANTASLVLIMHDLDAVDDRKTDDHLHWLVINIPATVHELAEGVPLTERLPDGTIQGKNVGGVTGYRGPGAGAAGPHHHYTFELFALDTKLDLGPDATRLEVLKAMEGHISGKGAMAGRFHRSK
jgi:Raf kinase inhibitor-like YbhB/YbcL family protein